MRLEGFKEVGSQITTPARGTELRFYPKYNGQPVGVLTTEVPYSQQVGVVGEWVYLFLLVHESWFMRVS